MTRAISWRRSSNRSGCLPILWLWVRRTIPENDRVENFPAGDAAPSRERRHAGTGLPIHERRFHHQIVTAWVSHGEVGFCRTATVVVRLFSRITSDDWGCVFFSPYSAA